MRILYIDIDSLRPDHLGCYGYARNTSPNIDAVAAQRARFDNCYVSDAPCLPSRTSLFSGLFGIHNGVVNHGGLAAIIKPDPNRKFQDRHTFNSWMGAFRQAGYRTATVSPFGERHSAWHFYAGFNEIINTGKCGHEVAAEISPAALDWLSRNGRDDNWFLHVNFWDPHTDYRTPLDFGEPFAGNPAPDWHTEEIRQRNWNGASPRGAQEPCFNFRWKEGEGPAPRMPENIDSRAAFKRWIDGYDTGVRYADHHAGLVLNKLRELGVYDDTLIVFSSDHGENLGELNVYGDHQTADQCTSRVPWIMKAPGVEAGRQFDALHYQNDLGATLLEMAGGDVPDDWDGVSFAEDLRAGKDDGRQALICSQMAWACQRAARWDNWMLIRSYHDGLKGYPALMLFDVEKDPHETFNLAAERPDLVGEGLRLIDQWRAEMLVNSMDGVDPMDVVIHEGGPYHGREFKDRFVAWLRKTGRAEIADHIETSQCRPSQ